MQPTETSSSPEEYRPSFDRTFLLRLLAKANPGGHHMGAVKPNKFTFLVSRLALESGLPAFRYRFIKDRLGPKSISVYTDLAMLRAVGLTSQDGSVTTRGSATLRALEPFFESQAEFTGLVDRVAASHGHVPRHRLVDQVHRMEARAGVSGMNIGEAPLGSLLLDPSAGAAFELSEAWGETLDLVYDMEAQASLRASEEDVRFHRVRPFQTEFGSTSSGSPR